MNQAPRLSLIVAMDPHNVIGYRGELPWHLPDDLKWFKQVTMNKPVIMGRTTHESIGRALPGRRNVVLTSKSELPVEGVETASSLQEALDLCREAAEVVVIGGAGVYLEALPICSRIYLTRLEDEFKGDTWFPDVQLEEWMEKERTDHSRDDRHSSAFSRIILERKMEDT